MVQIHTLILIQVLIHFFIFHQCLQQLIHHITLNIFKQTPNFPINSLQNLGLFLFTLLCLFDIKGKGHSTVGALQVEKRALLVWGSEDALEEAIEKKEDQREVKKQKKYNKKMKGKCLLYISACF